MEYMCCTDDIHQMFSFVSVLACFLCQLAFTERHVARVTVMGMLVPLNVYNYVLDFIVIYLYNVYFAHFIFLH